MTKTNKEFEANQAVLFKSARTPLADTLRPIPYILEKR